MTRFGWPSELQKGTLNVSELLTAKAWTAADILNLFRHLDEDHSYADQIWYGTIRSAWIESKWSDLITVTNVSRNNEGLPNLGPDDFDGHDGEIEDWATTLADIHVVTNRGTKVGTGQPIVVAFRQQTRPTVFCEQATEQEVRKAIHDLRKGSPA